MIPPKLPCPLHQSHPPEAKPTVLELTSSIPIDLGPPDCKLLELVKIAQTENQKVKTKKKHEMRICTNSIETTMTKKKKEKKRMIKSGEKEATIKMQMRIKETPRLTSVLRSAQRPACCNSSATISYDCCWCATCSATWC